MRDVTSATRNGHRSAPGVEPLEGRQLLSTAPHRDPTGHWHNLIIHDKDLSRFLIQKNFPVPLADRRIEYATPDGGRAVVTLYGRGSLAGTRTDGGVLDLVLRGTDQDSGVVGKVYGGKSGRAPLRSVAYADVPAPGLSGVGGSALNVLNLRQFDLLDGGRVNLTGGVHTFLLNSVGANTEVQLRELPSAYVPQPASTTSGTTTGTTTGSSSSTTTPTLPLSVTQNGVTLGYTVDPVSGARTLTSVSGTFTPGTNLSQVQVAGQEGTKYAPPGIIAVINEVNGPSRASQGVGTPQVIGYDAKTNRLVQFDLATGASRVFKENALPNPVADAGVALGLYAGRQVVLASDGTTAVAYNVLDGTEAGKFSLANLAPAFTKPTRLGSTDVGPVIGDTTGGAGEGRLQILDLTRSIQTGQAQVVGVPFDARRQFGLSGGVGSVAGSPTVFAAGGAIFDPFQPNVTQLGALSLSYGVPTSADPAQAGLRPREAARTALTVLGQQVTSNARGGAGGSPNNALAGIDQALGLITGVRTDPVTGQKYNEVSLFSPTSFARLDTARLNYPTELSAISSVFRPTLAGAALVDVQGNIQSFRSKSTRGLVLNDLGNLNLVKIQRAADTTILGYPFGHAEIAFRDNVTILSPTRTVGDRNGVTVLPGLKPTAPLTLP